MADRSPFVKYALVELFAQMDLAHASSKQGANFVPSAL
eukprot:CAMPEP_0179478930 /NCGR_PEP_ID=MMETSP0799-20121207/57259_1 /TAXON_ID=46947 /ORGANISM="Geminigera cryophila, Strain CCMP2564" /LENGTH=37 /DNA_ID= /DNA_START= /DNA_END= /DNA_ORIENTATION=